MKQYLRRFICLISVLCIAFVITVEANDYLTYVGVEVVYIHHDDGTITGYITRIVEAYGTHHEIGSHQHESPIVDISSEPENCPGNGCSHCT